MIILDTNQLDYGQVLDGPLMTVLRTLAVHTGHRLRLPEIVLEEHLAHFRHRIEAEERKYRAAEDELKKLIPDLRFPKRAPINVIWEVARRANRIRRLFDVIETPDFAARESLLREARRQPPAGVSFDDPGSGARDVAIWLTAVAACAENSQELTYFVSADARAFGKGALKPELQDELQSTLAEHADAFCYCGGIDSLLAKIATVRAEVPEFSHIIISEHVHTAVKAVLAESVFTARLLSDARLGGTITMIPGIELETGRQSGRTVAYQIGEMTWVCARMTWSVLRNIIVQPGSREPWSDRYQVAMTFKVVTTVLMVLDDSGAISAADVTARGRPMHVDGRMIGLDDQPTSLVVEAGEQQTTNSDLSED